MRAEEILGQVRDTLTVRQVFGEPYERDGVLVVPVARVAGGAGGGGGGNPTEGGSGGGFALEARPVGVYVVRDGEVSWRPAVDVTRIALGGSWWPSSPCWWRGASSAAWRGAEGQDTPQGSGTRSVAGIQSSRPPSSSSRTAGTGSGSVKTLRLPSGMAVASTSQ
jgi:hypothetical protein